MWRIALLIVSALALASCSALGPQGLNVVGERLTFQGNSMAPAIPSGTTVVVQKTSDYRRGDIVAVESPSDRRVAVRRIVGQPGETLEVRGGKVLIDGTALDEPYVAEAGSFSVAPVALGQDQYYVLADNRNAAGDSRAWGPVAAGLIHGVVRP